MYLKMLIPSIKIYLPSFEPLFSIFNTSEISSITTSIILVGLSTKSVNDNVDPVLDILLNILTIDFGTLFLDFPVTIRVSCAILVFFYYYQCYDCQYTKNNKHYNSTTSHWYQAVFTNRMHTKVQFAKPKITYHFFLSFLFPWDL